MTMKRLTVRSRTLVGTSALCLASVLRLSAQTTAPAEGQKPADSDTIVLSPFVVDASEDANGYAAKSTLAGTRVRTDLRDVASAISVVTQQFLQDTGAKNSADLLVYTPSTDVGGIRGNFSGAAGTAIAQENTISTTTRVRGLDSADNTRDYFLTDIPWDSFNVGRVDLQRGPNSILFGTGSPAGIINTSVNDASFKTRYNVENRLDEYGSVRFSVDLNQNLIEDVLAIRFAAVDDNAKYEQKPAYNHSKRYYGAMRFEPKLFGEGNHTSLRVKYEDGNVDSNNPRTLPPVDDVSLWFAKGKDAYGHYGYDKLLINQYSTTNPTPWGPTVPPGGYLPGGKGGPYAGGLQLTNAVRSFWPDLMNYYEATDPSRNSLPSPPIPSGTSLRTIANQPNIGLNPSGLQGANPNYLPLAIPMSSAYYRDIGTNNNGANSNNPGATTPIPGGIYYNNMVLRDPSIFNFYKLLADGPNKKEWQKWKAFNVALDQQFWHNRVGMQLAYDHQDFRAGAEQWMTGENYNINIDINATFADGTPNPNAGRPYFGNGASAPGLNYQNQTVRESMRFTPTLELNAADFLDNKKLAWWIGKHNLTGVVEQTNVKKDYMNWAKFATTAEYPHSGSLNNNAANTLNSNRSFEWVAYIGPSLIPYPSAAGAHLTNIPFVIAPPTSQYARVFNSNWNKPTNPNDPSYVNPADPYTYTNYQSGAQVAGTQRDNPANYVGWTTQNIDWMRSSDPNQFPSLVESANRTRVQDDSTGITWQGYFMGGDLVPTFGWRKDVLTSYQTQAYTDPLSGYTSLDYKDNLDSRRDVEGVSKSWGAVYHLSWLNKHLPWSSTLSVFYNRSENFKADASRLDLAGNVIPNATGKTEEYGFMVTTMNDKLSLKANWFKTKVANATLAGTEGNSIAGLGQNAYFIADGSIWGWSWAANVQEGLLGNTPNSTHYDAAQADGLPRNTPAEIAAYDAYNRTGGTFTDAGGTKHTYVGGNAIVNAWLHAPFPSNFFSSYSLTPQLDPTLAYKSGRLVDAYVGGIPGGYAGGVPAGGGSSFGNHQTTVDTLSDGTEVELTYQPIKNWNITVNYAKINATRENIDPVSQEFLSTMTGFMNGPGGQVREWFNGGGTLGAQWNSSIVAPYAVTVNQLGHEAPEVAPWRLNAVTTYTFDKGKLNGLFIGGALRIEAGRILGYEYDPTYHNSITDDPNYASVIELTKGGLNVDKPLRGPDDQHFDAWIGYTKKFGAKLVWRIQLNVRDVGKSDRLTPACINPDGSYSLMRIQQGMGFQLTNSVDF